MTQTVHYRLIVRRGPQPNQVFELTADSIMLGRDIINDITIGDPEVSRQHCNFAKQPEGGYTIEDLGSTNGTFINGTKLTGKHNLQNGDKIGFGETVHVDYAVTTIDIPKASSAFLDETRPMESAPSTAATSSDQETGKIATPGKTEPPSAPPAYVYTPAASTQTTPEAKRMSLFACVVLIIFCVIGAFMSIILIDAADKWADVPVVGDWFDSSDTKMEEYETSRFTVDVPEEWHRGVIDFSDNVFLAVSPDEVPFLIENSSVARFTDASFDVNPSVQIFGLKNDDNLGSTLAAMEAQFFENSTLAASEVVNRSDEDLKIDGQTAIAVEYELKRPPASEVLTHMKVAIVKKDGWTIVFVGISQADEPDKDFAIFDDMIKSIKFKE